MKTLFFISLALSALLPSALAFSASTSQPASCVAADLSKVALSQELAATVPRVGQELYITHAGYQRMKTAINSCQRDAFKSCYSQLKPAITVRELELLFAEWRKRRHYKLTDPSGLCYNRAYLLARELTEIGYAVQLIHIAPSPAIVSITRNDEGVPTHQVYYAKHWIVQIMATDSTGVTRPMLLDPQFAMTPMHRDNYFVEVTGQICVNQDRGNIADCIFTVHEPTYQIYPSPDLTPALQHQCGWSLTERLTTELENTLATMPASFEPMATSYEVLRQQALKGIWHGFEYWLRDEIQKLEIAGDRSKLERKKLDLLNVQERRSQLGL